MHCFEKSLMMRWIRMLHAMPSKYFACAASDGLSLYEVEGKTRDKRRGKRRATREEEREERREKRGEQRTHIYIERLHICINTNGKVMHRKESQSKAESISKADHSKA